MNVYEVNFDGLVGPNHNYAGLAAGNMASTANALSLSNPAAAARQGLKKMRFLHHLGLKQAIIPPHQRPNLHLLHQLGFYGSPAQQLERAQKADINLLAASYSASSMWTANAATVSPSQDTQDHRVHFTAANLVSNLHRHQEADFSSYLLKRIFPDEAHFFHHPILPKTPIMGDEGAANHSRLCKNYHDRGVHLFVYGKRALPAGNNAPSPKNFHARQTLEASLAIARSHKLSPDHVVFAQQNPKAIDQGVFHNDVISVANESLLLIHEDAFLNQSEIFTELTSKASFALQVIEIKRDQVSIDDAVKSYLFNSQLITLPSKTKAMALIAPTECEQYPTIQLLIDELIASSTNPLQEVHYLDLKQSMRNGGGPACLRLRVVLNEQELQAMHQGCIVTDPLLDTLEQWVDKHYRTELSPHDLADPQLMNECFYALDELSSILDLGPIYPFQKEKNL